jgi:hypothetical protein
LLTGQNAAFGNANTGMNTQYQGAATGLGSVYNNANTGIGSVYQGNLSGQNNIYGSANTGLGTVYNTGIAGQNNMLTAANSGLNAQYQNAMNPAQYQEYLNYQRQGIGDQYIAQLQSGNAQAAYNTGSILQQQQAGYANKFAGTAANTPMASGVNAPFASNTQLQQTSPNYGGMLSSIGSNLGTGSNNGGWFGNGANNIAVNSYSTTQPKTFTSDVGGVVVNNPNYNNTGMYNIGPQNPWGGTGYSQSYLNSLNTTGPNATMGPYVY